MGDAKRLGGESVPQGVRNVVLPDDIFKSLGAILAVERHQKSENQKSRMQNSIHPSAFCIQTSKKIGRAPASGHKVPGGIETGGSEQVSCGARREALTVAAFRPWRGSRRAVAQGPLLNAPYFAQPTALRRNAGIQLC